jgi:hypothetical protein
MQWYDPRTGLFVGSPQIFGGNQLVELGQPPLAAAEDWVVLVKPVVSSYAFSGSSDTYLPFITRPCS